ncbi:twin-arginine translocation signal domain-containing protein [Haloprofundus salinisoli]|uniref:twin-arginine translocation signal domain-containing protein n=1 Tax=Haloprofundus salinisoli TaxID=2876193 RepID=UPI001CC8F255|nr:twin-arginine translocation signal domain-containing protein [Haloprofundus salinisoli]
MTTPTSSRRTFLRRVGAAGALGVATVGCLGRAPPVVVATASESTSLAADSGVLGERAFAGYVSQMARRYGDSGVWGTDEPPSPTEADFENARRLSLRAALDGDEYAVADAAVARYGLRRFDTDGRRHVAYWLWCAARPLTDSVWLDAVGRSIGIALTSFEVGVDLDSAADLFDSAPTARVSGPQAVSVATAGESDGGAVFGVDFPLRDGRLRPRVADVTDGGNGRDSYRIGWRGRFGGVQSVNGLCVVGESVSGPDPTTDWHVSLSAAGWV